MTVRARADQHDANGKSNPTPEEIAANKVADDKVAQDDRDRQARNR